MTSLLVFSSGALVVSSTISTALWSPFIPAGLARSRGGRESLGKRAAAGCEVTMVAVNSSSLPSTALLFLFECLVEISISIKPTHESFVYFLHIS